MGKLDGKVAVVTGGGSGVGKALAFLFLKEGARVVIAGRDPAKLNAVVAEANAGNNIRSVPTDVTSPAQCQTLIQTATETFGRVELRLTDRRVVIQCRFVILEHARTHASHHRRAFEPGVGCGNDPLPRRQHAWAVIKDTSGRPAHDEPRVWWKEWIKARIVRLCGAYLVGGAVHAAYIRLLLSFLNEA